MASIPDTGQDADVLVRIPAHWLDGRYLSTNHRPESDGTAGRSVTGSQVDHTDVGQPVEHQLHPERCEQETEHLLGDEHPARIQLAADLYCPAEDGDVEREHRDKHADTDSEHGDRAGLCRQGDEDDDPGRVEQVGTASG